MKPEVLERIRAVKRASQVLRAGTWRMNGAIDQVVLDADERYRRRIVMTGEGGSKFLLDLPEVTALRDGDGLLLDDGMIVAVVARSEPLVEIAAKGAAEQTANMARLAWHLGNRLPRLRSPAASCGCGAITCWRRCWRGSGRASRRSRRRSSQNVGRMGTLRNHWELDHRILPCDRRNRVLYGRCGERQQPKEILSIQPEGRQARPCRSDVRAPRQGHIMRNITIIIGLATTLAGCGIAAKVDARKEYRASVAAYKECLATRAPKYCEAQRLAMEADERQYDNLAAGTQGGNRTANINIQNR